MMQRKISFLGERLKAVNRSDDVRFEGEYVYESMKMIHLRLDSGRIVKLPKESFIFYLPDGRAIDGRALLGRLSDRLVKN